MKNNLASNESNKEIKSQAESEELKESDQIIVDSEDSEALKDDFLKFDKSGKLCVSKELKGVPLQKALEKIAFDSTGLPGFQEAFRMLTEIKIASMRECDKELESFNSVSIIMHAMRPRDPMEAQLIGQMIILHNAGIDCFVKANFFNESTATERYQNRGLKLFKTHLDFYNLLNRYREKNQNAYSIRKKEIKILQELLSTAKDGKKSGNEID